MQTLVISPSLIGVSVFVRMNICEGYVFADVGVWTYADLYKYAYVCILMTTRNTHALFHTHTHTYTRTHTHMHTHTHTHTFTTGF